MVKKAKLLPPLLLSLTSIFCVGYAGWTLSGNGVSTSVSASSGDVLYTGDYFEINSLTTYTYSSDGFVVDETISKNTSIIANITILNKEALSAVYDGATSISVSYSLNESLTTTFSIFQYVTRVSSNPSNLISNTTFTQSSHVLSGGFNLDLSSVTNNTSFNIVFSIVYSGSDFSSDVYAYLPAHGTNRYFNYTFQMSL